MKKFNEFIKEKNITESNGFSRTPQINLKRTFPTPEEVEEEEKLKEKPKPISTEDMLRKKLEASEEERRALQAVIDHYHKKAPLERESAVKSELKKIKNSIELEFASISKYMNSSENINMPPNVKSSWNIFDKEMNRIFNFDIWH
jgi:molecular chaperone GrpE (heat shock protein)